MSIKVLGDDGEDNVGNKPVNNRQDNYKPDKDNGYLILPIVLIMGAILIAGLWLTSAPCPSMSCPNVTTSCPEAIIPACPSCPDCNPTIQCTLNTTNNTNNYSYGNITAMSNPKLYSQALRMLTLNLNS
jgi:hypothetical protein